jgi:hypothetical protein
MRPRVHRSLLGWDLRPLLAALDVDRHLPLMGGTTAAADLAAALDALVGGPVAAADGGGGGGGGSSAPVEVTASDRAAAESLQRALVAAGGFGSLVKVMQHRGLSAHARAAALSTTHQLLAALGGERAVKDAFAAAGGPSALAAALRRPELPLAARGRAAGCLHLWMAPEAPRAAQTRRSGSPLRGQQLQQQRPPGSAASGASEAHPLSAASAGTGGIRGESRGTDGGAGAATAAATRPATSASVAANSPPADRAAAISSRRLATATPSGFRAVASRGGGQGGLAGVVAAGGEWSCEAQQAVLARVSAVAEVRRVCAMSFACTC